jgi:hypothetical protein
VRVESKSGRTPFLSANDRSRWSTVRALVDHGTYALDEVIFLEPPPEDDGRLKPPRLRRDGDWYSIDLVKHRGVGWARALLFQQAAALGDDRGWRVLDLAETDGRAPRRPTVLRRFLAVDDHEPIAHGDRLGLPVADSRVLGGDPIGGECLSWPVRHGALC